MNLYDKIEILLSEDHLLQITTSDDVYYIGPIWKLNRLCYYFTESQKYNTWCEEKNTTFGWISDNDMYAHNFAILNRFPLPVPTSKEVLQNFKKVVSASILGIYIKKINEYVYDRSKKISEFDVYEKVVYEYVEKEWDFIFAQNVIIACMIALENPVMKYDCMINFNSDVIKPKFLANENYLQLNWKGSMFEDIRQDFEKITFCMNKWVKEEKTIVIYNECNVSSAGSCAMVYMIQFYDFKKALQKLQEKMPMLKPNTGHLKQLLLYSQKLHPETQQTETQQNNESEEFQAEKEKFTKYLIF